MNTLITIIVIAVVSVLPITLALTTLLWQNHQRKLEDRRSPLSGKVAHLPGEQLQRRMNALLDKIDQHSVLLLIVGPLTLMTLLLPRVQWQRLQLSWLDWAVMAAATLICIAAILRLRPLWHELRTCREGRIAEIAVAQQLDHLQLQGLQVLHDIPAGNFNLDHVVLGTSAVFMVETKSRRKPGTGKVSAQVSYDGKGLQFPCWAETKPLEQARAQARWLADYLFGETGEAVPVVPVVCLPGWYINFGKDAGRSDVKVINQKFMLLFTDAANRPTLNAAQRTRIVHALFKRYPELEA